MPLDYIFWVNWGIGMAIGLYLVWDCWIRK